MSASYCSAAVVLVGEREKGIFQSGGPHFQAAQCGVLRQHGAQHRFRRVRAHQHRVAILLHAGNSW